MKWAKNIAIGGIRVYQAVLGPYLGGRCRFYPSCSEYGCEAVERHGVVKGIGLTAMRVAKCHPFHRGGVDLVPDPRPRARVHHFRKETQA